MLSRQIFRKTSLEKMTNMDDLDELLQVNSIKTWLLFSGICAVLAGMLAWGFLGTISHNVQGFGIIKTQAPWREVLADRSGQLDSVFCNTGDRIATGQKMATIFELENKTYVPINSLVPGQVVAINVREGTYVTKGTSLFELMLADKQTKKQPEVIFFIVEKEVSKLKKGMFCNLQVDKQGVPPELLNAVITFISDYSVSKNTISKYFPGGEMSDDIGDKDFYEVRAFLKVDPDGSPNLANFDLSKLNWLTCRVNITVERKSPIAFLFK